MLSKWTFIRASEKVEFEMRQYSNLFLDIKSEELNCLHRVYILRFNSYKELWI